MSVYRREQEAKHNAKMIELISPKEQDDRFGHKANRDHLSPAIAVPPAVDASDDAWMEWILKSELSMGALINVLGKDKGKRPAARLARIAIYGHDANGDMAMIQNEMEFDDFSMEISPSPEMLPSSTEMSPRSPEFHDFFPG